VGNLGEIERNAAATDAKEKLLRNEHVRKGPPVFKTVVGQGGTIAIGKKKKPKPRETQIKLERGVEKKRRGFNPVSFDHSRKKKKRIRSGIRKGLKNNRLNHG